MQVNIKYWINFTITTLLIFGAHWMPSFYCVTEYGATILLIFVGLIFGFATVGLIEPSFMALLSIGFTEYGTVGTVLKDALGSNTILFTIGVMILSATLEESGVTQKLVDWVVTNKYIKKSPWTLTFVILLASYLVALFVNAVVPMLLFWSFVSTLCDKARFEKNAKWPAVMYFGIAYMATVASFIMPFQVGVIANFGMLAAASNGTITYSVAPYLIWSTICSLLLFVESINDSSTTSEKLDFNRNQLISIIMLSVMTVVLVISSMFPDSSLLGQFFAKLETSGIILLLLIVLLSIRIKGKAIFQFSTLLSKGVIWDIIFMLATIFFVVSVLTDPKTGIAEMIQALCTPFISKMSPLVFIVSVSLVILILSNLMMNAAVCCTLIPVLYILTENSDVNILLFVAMINFLGGMALLLPGSSAGSAMLYAQIPTKWIAKKNILIYSLFTIIATYIVILLIGYPLGKILL